MADYEILKNIKFDVKKLYEVTKEIEESFDPYFLNNSCLGGWSIQKQPNGEGVTSTFGGIHAARKKLTPEQEAESTSKLEIDPELAKKQNYQPEMNYTIRTPACVGYLNTVLDTFEKIRLPFYRTRLIKTAPYGQTAPHYDQHPGKYFVRIQIPIYSPPEFKMIIEDNEYHWPADGSAYIIRADKLHGSINRSNEARYTLLASIYDFDGITENYQCTPEEKENVLRNRF